MNNNISQNENNSVQKKKKNKTFNIVDLFVLLLIITLIAALIYAFSPWNFIKSKLNSDKEKVEYVVKIENVDVALQEVKNIISAGQTVLYAETGKEIGHVIGFEFDEAKTLSYKKDQGYGDEIVGDMSDISDKCTLLLIINVDADYKKDVGYTANGQRIAVGEKLSVKLPNFSGNGICTDISLLQEGD